MILLLLFESYNFKYLLNFDFHFCFPVWAETGDFRDNTHSAMNAVTSGMDHNQLNFQTSNNSRSRSRDRKGEGMF